MYYSYNSYEKNIIRDIKRMTDESKQLERIMHQDDLNLDKIDKIKKLLEKKQKKKKFLNNNNQKKQLPKLIKNNLKEEKEDDNLNTNKITFRNKPIKTLSNFNNNNLILPTDYTTLNSFRDSKFNLNNPLLNHTINKEIEYLDGYNNILKKINETYKKLPFYYKRLNKNYQYNNGQLISDESLINRYNKKDDIPLNINTIKNKILSPELNMTFHPNYTKDYFFKKSLIFNNKNVKNFYINKHDKTDSFLFRRNLNKNK